MEGLRMGQAPEDRQSGALLEGFEWSIFSSVESGAIRVVGRSNEGRTGILTYRSFSE